MRPICKTMDSLHSTDIEVVCRWLFKFIMETDRIRKLSPSPQFAVWCSVWSSTCHSYKQFVFTTVA